MRSALKGGSEGTTGTAITGNVDAKVLAVISINLVRDTVHLPDQRGTGCVRTRRIQRHAP